MSNLPLNMKWWVSSTERATVFFPLDFLCSDPLGPTNKNKPPWTLPRDASATQGDHLGPKIAKT